MKKNIAILLYGYIVVLVMLTIGVGWQYWRQIPTPNNSCLQNGLQPIIAGASCSGQASYFSSSTPLSIPQLTLGSIFNPDHAWINQLPSDSTIILITTGDIIPGRTVNYKMTQYNNFRYPFEKTAEFLRQADLTLINLEAPLPNECPVTIGGMTFCGNQQFIDGLIYAGIDVVNLANNHSLNWGQTGLQQTVDLLERNQILASGTADQLSTRIVKGVKLGFLGWNLLESFNVQDILNKIKESKAQVDLLIISSHWGAEYTSTPTEWEIMLARAMIDNGADLIVGNHPHWIQPIEIYKNKLIIYAQGNFIFDQEWSKETKLGIVGKHIFYQGQLVDSQFYPVKISDFSQPQFLEGQEKETVLIHLENISRQPKE